MDGKLLFLGLVFVILILAWVGAGVLWRAAEMAEIVAPIPAAEYDEFTVIAVGTGNASENPERGGPATAIGFGRTVVLVDAGRGVAEGLRIAQIPLDQPALLVLTNLLPANTIGVDDLLLTGWLTPRTKPLTIVGPEGTQAFVAGLEAAHRAGRDALGASLDLPSEGGRIEVIEASDGYSVEIEGLTVEARSLPGGPLPTLAWRFSAAKQSAVVSGSGWGRETLESFAGGADVLIHEAAYLPTVAELEGTGAEVPHPERIEREKAFHTSIEIVGEIAARAQVARLVLVRLRPPPFFDLQVRSLVAQDFDGAILIPEDGEVVFP